MKLTSITKALLAGVALLGMAGTANAIIILTPTTAGVIPGTNTMGPSNCEPGCVETIFGTSDLLPLYKSDWFFGFSIDSGSYASSYDTAYSNSLLDPSNALITYEGGAAIDCPSCYLAIKDGNQSPGYYFYDLSAWDGHETISLENFWPGKGAISHIGIWGLPTPTNVPEPSTLGLFGLGLLALGIKRRWRRT